jgi:multimeric flavodoxin WrbA
LEARAKRELFFMSSLLAKYLGDAGVTSSISFLYDYEIKPCADCRGCKKGELKCVLKDDMPALYAKLEEAGTIVVSTPIYWFGPSAKTKLFIDRLRPNYANKHLKGKKVAILLPTGTGAPDCNLTIEMFKRVCTALEIEFLGAVTLKAYDIGDAGHDKAVRNSINELVAKIVELS